MKNLLTSQDILHAEFKKSMRGYDTKEVDYFLDEIAATLEYYSKKITELEEFIAKNKEQLASFEETRELMQSTLLMAQKSAEARVERARSEAEEIIAVARTEAEDIRNGAYKEKSELFSELEKTKQVREAYFAEAKEMLAHFGKMLDECEKPSETELKAVNFMKDFEKIKSEEKDAQTEFKADNLRFEYEQEQPVLEKEEMMTDKELTDEDSITENAGQHEKTTEDIFTLCDSEELIQKDAQAERCSNREPDDCEIEAQDLAQAEKTAFTDENQSNLFGEDEEPTKLAKQINYAESDNLDE